MSLKKIIKDKFDYDVTGLADYVDEQSDELLTRSVLSGRTMSLFNVQEGVKGKEEIKILDDNIVFQDGSGCNDTPDGDTVFTDKQIETTRIKIEKHFCNEDLVGKWTQIALLAGAARQDEELPFEETITNYLIQLSAREKEFLLHRGDVTLLAPDNNRFIDGYIKKIGASGSVVASSADGTVPSASNMFDNMRDLCDSTGEQILENDDYAIYVPFAQFRQLVRNLQDLNNFHFTGDSTNTSIILPGTDIPIYSLPGLNGQKMMFGARRSNMVIGVDLMSDTEEFKLFYDERDDKLIWRHKFRIGVEFPFDDEITKHEWV